MPAEWLPHAHCWMAWPCNEKLWGEDLDPARDAYAHVARTIAAYEPVTMVADPAHVDDAQARCGDGINVLPLPISDSWMRDTGPTFLLDGQQSLAAVDWQFNNYGNKEGRPDDVIRKDAGLAGGILNRLGVKRFAAPLVLEGGSIHVDGEGTVLTSEQCLLNPNRNPGLSRDAIEKHLCDYLGASRVIWLGQGLQDDDTDGHVDNLACFVRPGVVMALTCNDAADPNHAVLQDNLQRLQAARDAAGRRLEVIEIEQPAMRHHNGMRLAMSYVNFYLANGAVIMPTFDQAERDNAALAVMAKAFPERRIMPVPGSDIIKGGGNVHCITQQQPQARN